MKLSEKLNQKQNKLIAIVGLIIIGIVIIAFSFNGHDNNTKDAKDVNNKELAASNEFDNIEPDSKVSSFAIKKDKDDNSQESAEDSVEAVEPEIEKNKDPQIQELIKKYMDAKLKPSQEAFEGLVNDVSLLNVEKIKGEAILTEGYKNTEIYSVNTPQDGVSLVYAYSEVKFLGIETPAPAANRYIVVSKDGQSPYIYNRPEDDSEFDEIYEFAEEFEQTDSYNEFIEEVNAKLKTALDNDEILAQFFLVMHSNNNSQVSEDEASEPSVDGEKVSEEIEGQDGARDSSEETSNAVEDESVDEGHEDELEEADAS